VASLLGGMRAVCLVQLGPRVAELCDVVARARTVVSRDGGPEGGVLGCARSDGASGWRDGGPETLAVLRALTSCHAGNRLPAQLLGGSLLRL
jgi:hypothetical protein